MSKAGRQDWKSSIQVNTIMFHLNQTVNCKGMTQVMNPRPVMASLERDSTPYKQFAEEPIYRIGIEGGAISLYKEGMLRLGYPCYWHPIPVHQIFGQDSIERCTYRYDALGTVLCLPKVDISFIKMYVLIDNRQSFGDSSTCSIKHPEQCRHGYERCTHPDIVKTTCITGCKDCINLGLSEDIRCKVCLLIFREMRDLALASPP